MEMCDKFKKSLNVTFFHYNVKSFFYRIARSFSSNIYFAITRLNSCKADVSWYFPPFNNIYNKVIMFL